MAFQRKKPAAIGIKANYPGFIEPALAASIAKVPSGERLVHEIKFDGYRVQVHLRDAAVKVFTRRGNDWTKRLRKIARTFGTSMRAPQSSMGKWLSRPLMAPTTFRYSRTNSRDGQSISCWSRSICCTSMGVTCEAYPSMTARPLSK